MAWRSPAVVVTRKLPEAVEARLAAEFDAVLNAGGRARCRARRWRARCARRTGCSAR